MPALWHRNEKPIKPEPLPTPKDRDFFARWFLWFIFFAVAGLLLWWMLANSPLFTPDVLPEG